MSVRPEPDSGSGLKAAGCPACASPSRRDVGEKNGFQLMACGQCGTLYAIPRSSLDYGHLYEDYYNPDQLAVPPFIRTVLDTIIAGFDRYRERNHLLDVGCGRGNLLEAAADAGWKVSGTDLSRPVVDHLRKRGLDVHWGDLPSAAFPDGHFDVVTISEVLEHVPSPGEMLREVRRVLRPGGVLWATTPNGRGLSARLMKLDWSIVTPPEHLQLFSTRGLSALLRSTGFARVRIRTSGFNPLELLHYLRRGRSGAEDFNRRDTSLRLNELSRKGALNRAMRALINRSLDSCSLGDSLKAYAE